MVWRSCNWCHRRFASITLLYPCSQICAPNHFIHPTEACSHMPLTLMVSMSLAVADPDDHHHDANISALARVARSSLEFFGWVIIGTAHKHCFSFPTHFQSQTFPIFLEFILWLILVVVINYSQISKKTPNQRFLCTVLRFTTKLWPRWWCNKCLWWAACP